VPVFLVRSTAHPAPVLPLGLFGLRSFTIANVAALVFGVVTGGILLANVLFLTTVWDYSLVRAGFGLMPGPLMAMVAAPLVGRAGGRFGERAVGVPGMIVIAAGMAWFRVFVDGSPEYVRHWLPAACMTGLGIAMVFPMLAVAVVRDVAPDQLSVASASNRTALQLGNAVGISLLIAMLGNRTDASSLGDFRRVWTVFACLAVACGVIVGAVGRTQRSPLRP
jgi:predicted MFS family arabinose efflux permease